jgi:hypothetical protein
MPRAVRHTDMLIIFEDVQGESDMQADFENERHVPEQKIPQ